MPLSGQLDSTADGPPLYVEVTPLLYPELTGVGRFVARLVEALAQRVSLTLFVAVEGDLAPKVQRPSGLRLGWDISVPHGSVPPAGSADLERWTTELLRLPSVRHDPALASRSVALYPWLRPPVRHFWRELGVLFDFTPVLLPWAHLPATRATFGRLYADTLGLCDRVVAISQATRFDACWLSVLPPERVVLGYPGPSLCVAGHLEGTAWPRRPNVALAVSTLEPRKNCRFLLDWFCSTTALPSDYELWWVGPSGWLEDAHLTGRGPVAGREVRFLGKVSDRELCRLYGQAALAIYPSLYEGFGFPVLDALLHGRPVLSSYNSSLAEFEGPGVYYFDACEPASLDEAYQALTADAARPVARPDLRSRCSWSALADQIVTL